jgi:hypothetical protein
MATNPAPSGGPTMNKPSFDWKLSRQKDALRIDYEGKNTLEQRIYIVDKLVASNGRNDFSTTDQAIVMNYDQPGQPKDIVKVVLGAEGSDRETATVFTPTYRPVEPGQPFSGSVSIPFPLKSWHPLGGTSPIREGASKILFKLYYFTGEPPKWREMPSTKQTPFRCPDGFVAKVLKLDPKPIP